MNAIWLATGESIPPRELDDEGVYHRTLDVDEAAYQPAVAALKAERGYVAEDVVALSPETPNLDAICDKFKDEHLHQEDEVRFVLDGAGVFEIRARDERWMQITVERGDLIVVPEGRYHRFFLTAARSIRCVRLFKDPSGWVPHYRADR